MLLLPLKLSKLVADPLCLDSPVEAGELWEQVRREKAAGGYPWTHLSHNEEEEVWINPLKLPVDISRWERITVQNLDVFLNICRETIRRRDGTIPPEWFHLPEGAETPSVEELLREDSPESDIESELLQVQSPEIQLEERGRDQGRRTPCGRKTPSGRRTPICGKHRHRHKSSTGSSPAPSLKSQYQSSSSLKCHHQINASQPERTEQVESPKSTSQNTDTVGYEPVGKNLLRAPSFDKIPVSRSPSSKLPTLPSQDADDSDSTTGCFPLRMSRSRSKERKAKKSSSSRRSPSRDSGCSEHDYETPKLLQKSFKNQAPEIDRRNKPGVKKKSRSDMEDGYEPVGKPLKTTESWISQQGKEFESLSQDKDVRNIECKMQGNNRPKQNGDLMVSITEKESGKIISKETIEDIVSYNNHLSDDNVVHLQRNLSNKSIKSSENSNGGLSKKELKRKKAEEEKSLKDEKKREKLQKDAELKKEKQNEKERIKEEKLSKEKEMKLKKQQEKSQPAAKQNLEKEESLDDECKSKSVNKSKSIIDTVIDKVRKLSTDEKDTTVSETDVTSTSKNENGKKKGKLAKDEEKKKEKLTKEEEKKKEKLAKEEENIQKKALEKEKEEEKKRQRENVKKDEKERLNLVKIEKERQSKELKELKAKKKENTKEPELLYADDEQNIRKPSL